MHLQPLLLLLTVSSSENFAYSPPPFHPTQSWLVSALSTRNLKIGGSNPVPAEPATKGEESRHLCLSFF